MNTLERIFTIMRETENDGFYPSLSRIAFRLGTDPSWVCKTAVPQLVGDGRVFKYWPHGCSETTRYSTYPVEDRSRKLRPLVVSSTKSGPRKIQCLAPAYDDGEDQDRELGTHTR